MTLKPGMRLGVYEIVSLLGSGGMGEVYIAKDSKLGRQVALKLLPPEMAEDRARRKRFEREAKAIAALNHPGVVTIYSVEEVEGIHFITMELVRGQKLSEVISDRGTPVDQFLKLAMPLADALAVAHAQGITHRDLKPDNIMVSADGGIKVLDFGLAQLTEDSDNKESFEGSLTDSATQEGKIVGTVHYMSPEQAEGKDVDCRSDIFTLGIVFYEMLTAKRPFEGDTPTSVMSSILKDTPTSVMEIVPGTPRELAKLIRRCLAKDPSRRYQSALELRNELEELNQEFETGELFKPISVGRGGSGWRLFVAALAGAAVVAAVLSYYSGRREPANVQVEYTQLTTHPGQELFPSLSPDGSLIAYARRQSDKWDIFLQRTGGRNPINLTEDSTSDDTQPVFSPDGEQIAFRSSRDGGGLYVMGATGEFVRRVTKFGYNPTWSPDGKEIAFASAAIFHTPLDRPTTSQLFVANMVNGETRLVMEGDAVQPSWSPNGHRIAFWGLPEGSGQRDIWTVPAEGGDKVAVTSDEAVDWNPVWSPDGDYLYFSSDRGGIMNLWRVAIDEVSGETRGEPEPVTTPSSYTSHLSISKDGRRMTYAATSQTQSLQKIGFDPDAASVVGEPIAMAREIPGKEFPHPSPDGEWVVFASTGMREDIYIIRADGTGLRQLTNDPHRDRRPRWSPDGTRIAFYSNRSGGYEIWAIGADGTGLEQLTDTPGQTIHYPLWSPDGSKMVYSSRGSSGFLFDLEKAWDMQTPQHLPPFNDKGDDFVPFTWSPDGKWLAGYIRSSAGVRGGLCLFSLDRQEYRRLTDFGFFPEWMNDGRRLLFQAAETKVTTHLQQDFKLFVLDIELGDVREVYGAPEASVGPPTLSSDNRSLYYVLEKLEADIWILEDR